MTRNDSKIAIDLLDLATDEITTAAADLLWSRRDIDIADLYRAGSTLTRIANALQEITSHLADALENYGRHRHLRDDAGADPLARLLQAETHLLETTASYRTAGAAAASYQSAIGHIGIEGDRS